MSIRLSVEKGGSAVVTDLGRHRGAAVGMPVNGALDQYAARVANILVANAEHAPLIEVTAFAFSFTADVDALIAVTGAVDDVWVDGVARPLWEPISVAAGQLVEIDATRHGLRSYIAVHGSFDVPLLLGSCAPDSVSGFGTRLDSGASVTLNDSVAQLVNPYFGISLFNLGVDVPHLGGTAVVHVTDGPDADDFAGTAKRLLQSPYTVSTRSNHIGLRLTGDLPERRSSQEVVSRGVPVGAVEVPPGDELLVLHRGRGVTAGYPVLAVVTTTALDTLAQVRPEQQVVFRRITLDEAHAHAVQWRRRLDRLRDRIATVFAGVGGETLAREAHLLRARRGTNDRNRS